MCFPLTAAIGNSHNDVDWSSGFMVWGRRALDGLYAIGAALGGLCLIGIVGLVVAQVTSRWLAVPLAGAPELAGSTGQNNPAQGNALGFCGGPESKP